MRTSLIIYVTFVSHVTFCFALIANRIVAFSPRSTQSWTHPPANNIISSPGCRSNNIKLHGFFDDLMKVNFGNEDEKQPEKNDEVEENTMWREADFRSEVQKRNNEVDTTQNAQTERSIVITADGEDEEEVDFDGYMVRKMFFLIEPQKLPILVLTKNIYLWVVMVNSYEMQFSINGDNASTWNFNR
jgi:hypothetical protein